MNVSIITNDNHTYMVDGVIIDGKRVNAREMSSAELSDGVMDSCMFYTYKGRGAVELLIPGTVVRQVTIRYTEEQLPLWSDV